MKSLKCFVYFLILIILGNFVLTGKEKVLPKPPTVRLPPPTPPPPPKWSDFKYNSEEEKEFWDKVTDFKIPDHYGWQRINSRGNKIDHDPFYKGYTGYQKKIEGYTSRILSKYQDGFLVKRASWYKSGKIKSEETYKDGKRFGVWNESYENGQKKSEINYKDGNREGFSTKWHSNGRKQTEVNYREGKPEGLFVAWDSNGLKYLEINYKDGKRHGLNTVFYPHGQKKSEVNYIDGRRDGVDTSWYENGQKESEINYKDGNRVGVWTKWYEDGKKMDDSDPILGIVYQGAEIDSAYALFPPKPKIVSQVKAPRLLIPIQHPNVLPPEHPSPFIRPGSRLESRPANSLAPKKVYIIKTKKPEWSDFKYNSEEEKIFWDKLPDFPIFDHFGARRVNLKGLSVDQNSTENGYTGYQKKISSFYQGQRFERILSKYQDGFLVKRASWYENGKKKSEETYKDGKRVGVWNEWYENGQIKSEGNYKDGIAIWTDWHKNGQKRKESNYKDELEDGLWTCWHDNGQKSSEGNYSKGEKEGLWVSWYWNSEKISSKGIYSDGEKKGFWTERGLEGNYTDGKRHGLWNEWYEKGKKKSEGNYKDGKPVGLWNYWYESGKKKGEKKFKEDSESGLHECIFWHENGQKKSEGLYIILSRTGLWTEWYENGQKKSEINYKNGKVSGNARYWTVDGRPTDKPEIRMPPIRITIPKKQEEQDQ